MKQTSTDRQSSQYKTSARKVQSVSCRRTN